MMLRKGMGNAADMLSRKLHLNVRFYGKAFSLFSLGYATNILRGLASTYLVARLSPPELYGQMRYMIALYGLAGIFTLAGFAIPLVKGLAKGDTFIARRVIRKIAFFSPIGTIFLSLCALERWFAGEHTVALSIFISALFFVPYTLCGTYVQIYTGLQRIKELTKADCWSNILYAVLFTVTLCVFRDLISITIAYFLIDSIMRGWFSLHAYRSIPVSVEGNNAEYDKLGRHMNAVYVMQSLTSSAGQILLQRFWGYRAVATFSVAAILPEQTISLMKTMNGTILQRLSRYKQITEGHIKNLQKQFRMSLIVTCMMIFAYAAIAPFVIPFLFPQYPDAVLPSIVYAIGFVTVASLIGMNAYQAYGNVKAVWKYSIITSSVQLFSSLALVPLIGNWGAVWSQVLMRVSGVAASYPRRSQIPTIESQNEIPQTTDATS